MFATPLRVPLLVFLLPWCARCSAAFDLSTLEPAEPATQAHGRALRHDWLLGGFPVRASVRRGEDSQTLVLDNGLVRRSFRLEPNAATIGLENLMTGAELVRAVEPESVLELDGTLHKIGGLSGQPDRGYLTRDWIHALTNDPAAFRCTGFTTGPTVAPFGWKRVRHAADLPWPPPGARLTLSFQGTSTESRNVTVQVHYELYDGLPVLGKWMSVHNGTARPVRIDHLETERLAMVEADSAVDERPGIAWRTPAVTVLSDYMFKGMDVVTGNQVGHWTTDPEYRTQVSYTLKTPCVLVCEPPQGPGIDVPPGEDFASFRTWLVIHDSTDRERQGLTLRHAHRALAPWSTENPLMMHVRSADTRVFRHAVDQCAEVGFEMIIYTFGSGLNMETDDPDVIDRVKADVEYAHSQGLEVGAYSLFSSRRINDENDVINPSTGKPGGAIFGNAPCLASAWGTNYLRQLTNFISRTGLNLLEHDGPYPGDVCASTHHPGHRGLEDSQWAQWRLSAHLYTWCRENGVYVNQPDYYFLAGGSKTAMGYRETNWSLPRAQQLVHGRQNIFDGTWTKPQTAGWMFVPLTEYQGGGQAATLEPLHDHLADYEAHLANNLGDGVQACWRGPRLYDSAETRDLVRRWVAWFKTYRDILESDILHARRADGRDIDYMVHVNPRLAQRAFAMVHNPLSEPVEREVLLPLYYAGLADAARVRQEDGPYRPVSLDRQCRALVTVRIPAHGRTWLVVEAPEPGQTR